MSEVRFLVSSIFFQVFISSCFSNAILLASSWASRSMLDSSQVGMKNLLLSALLDFGEVLDLALVGGVLVLLIAAFHL
jgi:hypothetical protein